MHLLRLVQNAVRKALAGMTDDVEPYAAMVKATQDAKHGDYQANAAMSLAKALGKNPRDVAQQIAERLDLGDWLDKPEVAGPGFINLRLRGEWLAKQLRTTARDERLGVGAAENPGVYVVDFSGPNVAKPMHVGHLRSTIIGDSLCRLLRFLGHTVVGDNHLGDWGTQFGMLLWGYKNILDKDAFAKDAVRELARVYVEVRRKTQGTEEDDKAGDPIAEASRQETAKLHAGDPENVRLWKEFMPHCLEELQPIYQRLDVRFDHQLGESFYNPMLAEVVRDLEAKGIARKSEGAVAIFYGEDAPPSLIQKRDGGFTYTTTDLATIKHRMDTWKPTALLYVVDSRQALHFSNLFDAAKRWGYNGVALEHIKFGSVLGPDGKAIKTRDGGAVELGSLLDEAFTEARKVVVAAINQSPTTDSTVAFSESEIDQIAEAVGIGAVKYADLSQNRTSDYIFRWSKMLAMNGNTGAYMQYAYARNCSILRKAGVSIERFRTDPPAIHLDSPHERALALQILRFEEALAAAVADYQPSGITTYLWDLAKTYSGFFQNCSVLKAESPELRESRLLLCDLTARVIQLCLGLLGIRTVERM
ncbi:MAG: arginine--tRNA ligase [Gemmataceae bacterium]|nr:arginine--tRNA ligase [Gemmataceae bacterium]